MVKMIVLGIDAASWNLIMPWIKDGELPTFKKLIEEGVHGDLESCIPFITSPAWKCFSTGKNPSKLGAFYWFDFDRETKRIRMVKGDTFKGKELWDYLSSEGYRCGLIDVPLTFPPKKINGFMISGFPVFDNQEYTYPSELKKELIKKFNYRVSPKAHFTDKEKILPDLIDLFNLRFSVAREMSSEKIDFLMLTIFSIDGLQHFYWKEKKVLKEAYKIIDEGIRSLLKNNRDDSYFFILSDHGATGLKASFLINMWLKEKGYLYFKEPIFSGFNLVNLLQKFGFGRDRVARIYMSFSRILNRIISEESVFVRGFGQQFVNEEGEIGITALLDKIDWKKTKALVIGEGLLYINANEDYEKIKEQLIYEIESIKDPKTNEKIAYAKKPEEIYGNKRSDKSPDLIIVPREGYLINDHLSINGNIWNFSTERWSAFHKLHGIFLAKGPGIKKGAKIDGAKIYDLAPTILHIFGMPIPKDMDGRVLKEIFEEGSELAKREVLYQEEKVRAEKRIRQLKKLKRI